MTSCRGVAEAVLEAGAAHVRVLARSLRFAFIPFDGRVTREESPSPQADAMCSVPTAAQSTASCTWHLVRSETLTLGLCPFQPHPVRMRTLVWTRRACRPRDGPGGTLSEPI